MTRPSGLGNDLQLRVGPHSQNQQQSLDYGALRFPDAPIRTTAAGYVSKSGAAHTRGDFKAFEAWQQAFLTAFGWVILSGILIVVEQQFARRAELRALRSPRLF